MNRENTHHQREEPSRPLPAGDALRQVQEEFENDLDEALEPARERRDSPLRTFSAITRRTTIVIHVATIVLVSLKLPMMGLARTGSAGDLDSRQRRSEESESECLAQRSTEQRDNEDY